MYREGHYGINALLYSPVAFITSVSLSLELAIIGAVCVLGVATLPDCDRHFSDNMETARSNIWTLIPIKHRGFTHTIWFAGIIGAVGAGLGVLIPFHETSVAAGFTFAVSFFGIVCHILGDALTPMGVKPFSPLSKTTRTVNLCNASNSMANYAFLLVGGVTLLAAFGISFEQTGIDLERLIELVVVNSQSLLSH